MKIADSEAAIKTPTINEANAFVITEECGLYVLPVSSVILQ